jgi:hypothetical protein
MGTLRAMEPHARKRQIMIWYVLVAVLGVLLFQGFWTSYSQVETVPYSEFETLLDQGCIRRLHACETLTDLLVF